MKTSGGLWQYYRNGQNAALANYVSFISKVRIKGSIPADHSMKDVKIPVPMRYFCSFYRTPEKLLINCEITLILTWSEYCVIFTAPGATKFGLTDTKLYVLVVTLSTQDNEKLLEQLKSGFKELE